MDSGGGEAGARKLEGEGVVAGVEGGDGRVGLGDGGSCDEVAGGARGVWG